MRSDHRPDRGDRILFAPDHKIGANLLKLKGRDPKYDSVIAEFPVLHLRKSKITNLCAAYKDLGILHLLMYMRDTDDQDWAKLLSSSHIDQATIYIRRLSMALHISFMLTFLLTLPTEKHAKLMEYLSAGELSDCIDDGFDDQYQEFLAKGTASNVIFAVHFEIMSHCNEVTGLAFSERLGGTDGYNLLLALVKNSLPFAFLNGSSSYALFSMQLLQEHYKCCPFCQKLKASLYTSPHKDSPVNFALDTQREMDHQDVSRSFRSGGTLSSVVPKMANVDFLQELKTLVTQQEATEEKQPKKISKSKEELLGLSLSSTDLAYINCAAALILRQGGISSAADDRLRNIYVDNSNEMFSLALLDRESIDVGKFLVQRCISMNHFFGCSSAKLPNIANFKGPKSLLHKAATMKGVTLKRTSLKLEKEKKSTIDIDDEKRVRKINKEKKRVDCLGSKMNACQAVVKPDCSKSAVSKADQIKKAMIHIMIDAYRRIHNLPHSELTSDVLKSFRNEALFVEGASVLNIPDKSNIGVITYEFAGVKFKGDYDSGKEYLTYVEGIIKKALFQLPNTHHMSISEEKYTFAPSTFKAPTHKQRSEKQSTTRSVHHLKPAEEIVSETQFSKTAIRKTIEGKTIISTYLAKMCQNCLLERELC